MSATDDPQTQYLKNYFKPDGREQSRWNLSDIDDAATLLRELMELEWRYHHLALLKYRNGKHKDFHSYFGMYWGCKTIINIIFPWRYSRDFFSHTIRGLDMKIKEEDDEMLQKHRGSP